MKFGFSGKNLGEDAFQPSTERRRCRRGRKRLQERGKDETQMEESIYQMGADSIAGDYGRHYVLLFAVSLVEYQIGF